KSQAHRRRPFRGSPSSARSRWGSTRNSNSSRPSTSTTGTRSPYVRSRPSSPSMRISRKANRAPPSRSASTAARASSHRPQVRREYMTTSWESSTPGPSYRSICYTNFVPTPRPEDARDADLHRRLVLGDRQAFEELYRRYSGAAFGLAHRVTGHELLAQEVVHDSYLALWRAPEAFEPARGPFRTFFL